MSRQPDSKVRSLEVSTDGTLSYMECMYVWASTAEKARKLCDAPPDSKVELVKATAYEGLSYWAVQLGDTISDQQAIYPGACSECSEESITDLSPENFREIGRLLSRNSESWTDTEVKFIIYTLERIIPWLGETSYMGSKGPMILLSMITDLENFRSGLYQRKPIS